jgi:hypothetical protein
VASVSGTIHSSPPPPTPEQSALPTHPDALKKAPIPPTEAEVVPDSQVGTIPEFYTSPIPVPPTFTFAPTPPTEAEVVPDSQVGTIPEFYTSPIPVPPTFTLIKSSPTGVESITESSSSLEPSAPEKKKPGRFPFK